MRLTIFRSTNRPILNTSSINVNSDICVFLVQLFNSNDELISTYHKLEYWKDKYKFEEDVKAQQIPADEDGSGTYSVGAWDIFFAGFWAAQTVYDALTRGRRGGGPKKPCPKVMEHTGGSKNITIYPEYQERLCVLKKA